MLQYTYQYLSRTETMIKQYYPTNNKQVSKRRRFFFAVVLAVFIALNLSVTALAATVTREADYGYNYTDRGFGTSGYWTKDNSTISISADNTSPNVGDSVTVTSSISNTLGRVAVHNDSGDESYRRFLVTSADWYVNGTKVETDTMSSQGGASASCTFTYKGPSSIYVVWKIRWFSTYDNTGTEHKSVCSSVLSLTSGNPVVGSHWAYDYNEVGGSASFTVPTTGNYTIKLFGGGGGGAGGALRQYYGSRYPSYATGSGGGGSGQSYTVNLTEGTTYTINIGTGGAGGAGYTVKAAKATASSGSGGGSTAFGPYSITGGGGGTAGTANNKNPGYILATGGSSKGNLASSGQNGNGNHAGYSSTGSNYYGVTGGWGGSGGYAQLGAGGQGGSASGSSAVTDGKKGNNGGVVIILNEIIDETPPEVTVSGNPTEWTGEDVILTASAVDQDSGSGLRPDGQTYSWNGGDWTDKTTFTVTAEDTIVKVKARDLAGNESAEETIVVGKLDKTSPSLSISKAIGGVSAVTDSTLWAKSGQNVVVTITASDAKSGVYEYTLDGNTWSPWPKSDGVNPDTSITLTYNTNTDTVLQINVRDLVGNTTLETPQQVPVRIDHDAPVITSATQAPSDGSEWVMVSGNQWTSKDVKITVVSTDTGGSGDPEARYSFDGGSTWQTENWFITSTNEETINVAVKDNAENITYQDVVVSGIDKAAPQSPTYVIEYKDDWKNTAKKVTVSGIIDDSEGCGIKSIEVTHNGLPVAFTTISETEITFNADENGDYQILITDNVGNFVNPVVTVSKIEKIKPVVSALSQTPTADIWTNGHVTITATAADTGDDAVRSEIAQYRFDVDGVEGAPKTEAFINVDHNCTVKVFAIDKAGNISEETAVSTITIRNIDTDKPIIDDVVKSTPDRIWTNSDITLTIKAHDDDGPGILGASGIKEYSTNGGTDWHPWPNGLTEVETAPYDANTNDICIIVRDQSGNESAERNESITNIDTTPPRDFTFSWESDWSMTYKTVTASPIKDDGGSEIANISVSYGNAPGEPIESTTDGETISFKAWKNGRYTVSVTDGAGNTRTKTENINNIDLVSPTVTEVTQNPASDVWTGGPERNKVTITATAVDNGEAIEQSGINAFGYRVDGGTIQWKEGSGKENFSVAQNCTIEVFTRDIAGNVSASPAQTVTIPISNIDITAPAKPVVSGNSNTWTNQDVTLKFQKPTDYGEDSTTEQSGVKWYRWSSGEEWTEWTGNNEVTKTVGKNQNVTAQVKDLVGHITTADTVSVTRIDKNDPKIQWGANPSGQSTWVKGPVTLRATISDEATSQYAASGIKEYSWNGEEAVQFTSSSIEYFVQDASTVNLQVTDNAGNTATSSITVSKIDGTAPNLSVMLTAASADRKGVITQLYATDSASGLAPMSFCWNYDPDNPGAAEWTNEAQRVLQSGKTYCIAARDNVGNVSYQTVKPKAYEMPNGGGNVPMFSQSTMDCSGYILGKTAYLDSVGTAHTYESEPLTMTVQAEPQYGGWMAGYAMLGSTKYPITWDTVGTPELTQEAATGTFTITPESFAATKKNVELTVHLFEYEDETKATRINQDTLSATVSIDVTPPITSISMYVDTITITSRDTLAGMEHIQYRMQGTEVWNPYTAPFTLPESGILEVRATDKVGNESTTASVYLTKTGGMAGGSTSPLDEGTASSVYRSYWFNYYLIGANDSE